jgi:hypothetical protein
MMMVLLVQWYSRIEIPGIQSRIRIEIKHDRTIHKLEHDGRLITDPDDIVNIMQRWYEQTAERVVPQVETLTAFFNTARPRTFSVG